MRNPTTGGGRAHGVLHLCAEPPGHSDEQEPGV